MMRASLLTVLALAVVSLPVVAPAQEQVPVRPQEQARLDAYDQAAGDALLQALSAGDPSDVAALTTALSGVPLVAFDETLVGIWSCRTLKLGGVAPLTVYTPFKCRIGLDATGATFEKLSGSQRTKGRIEMRDGRAVYLGVGFVADQAAPDYANLPPEFGGDGSTQPQVAVFERISEIRARLMFPTPVVESTFDILELTR